MECAASGMWGQLGTAAPAAPEGCGMVTWGWSTHFSSQQWQLLFLTHCFGYLTGVSEFNINRRAFWSTDIFNFCLVSELLPYFTASSSFWLLACSFCPCPFSASALCSLSVKSVSNATRHLYVHSSSCFQAIVNATERERDLGCQLITN